MKITPLSGFFAAILSAAVVAAVFALSVERWPLRPSKQLQNPAAEAAVAPSSHAVVLELFTSQGCSSCPSADELLRKLARDPDYRDRIIPLAYHVDYWDHLGWRDPFSSRQWSERQGEYVRAMKLESAYTPQMVINGARQMVGSSAFQIYRAIDEESKRKPEDRITLQVANGEAIVRAESKRGAELIVVAFEDGAVTKVERGENRGRTIANDAIVRKLVRAGMVNGTVEKRVALALAPKMGVVAFLQDPQTHRIMVAATTTR